MNFFPTMTETFASTTAEATVFFNAFLPWIYLAIGVVAGFSLLIFLIRIFREGLDKLFGHRLKYDEWKKDEEMRGYKHFD